ncbi:hypothetical protein JL720_16246 [Aureococcus anophagefferens]|nr:hypothetical protein JL720_16246 [Aureococcus anophagefferens]
MTSAQEKSAAAKDGIEPAEIAVLSALNARLDAIDVAGCDAIFDLLDKHNRNVLSLEELREGVRSDAVEDYIRETGNVVMKGLLKDWERSEARVGRALAALDPELTGKVTRALAKIVVSVAACVPARAGPARRALLLGPGPRGRREADDGVLVVLLRVPAEAAKG